MTSRSRGRPRKSNTARNKRIDAALDAMRPYGFDEALVRQTVDELLDVYDGEWFFIEDVSYRILVDTMLDKQQISSEEKVNSNIDLI
ncbi:ubiquitin-binding WIYLD domain protein [Senna tora]|uniref:Ubiquitin-binding WIYLD domain protein n=1 Tax=Senna tora TaxID=362788 RepID=A0A834U4F0_9FABA|nr:ubiquitin-binding WIYLD domain protein [Senna tora]